MNHQIESKNEATILLATVRTSTVRMDGSRLNLFIGYRSSVIGYEYNRRHHHGMNTYILYYVARGTRTHARTTRPAVALCLESCKAQQQ